MLRLNVVAHPGSRAERLELLDSGELGVWVRARPIAGQANTAIEHAIATALGLRPRHVKLIAGATARRKIVEVDLPDLEALHSRLLAYRIRAS
jgi:uncharacterized protein